MSNFTQISARFHPNLYVERWTLNVERYDFFCNYLAISLLY